MHRWAGSLFWAFSCDVLSKCFQFHIKTLSIVSGVTDTCEDCADFFKSIFHV